MSLRLSVIVPCLLVSSLLAAELAEKWTKRLDSADGNYREAVQKADNIRFYAVQKASAERIRLLKSAMMDATKAGDLDAANEIKAKLTAAESSGGIRPKSLSENRSGSKLRNLRYNWCWGFNLV